MTALIAGCAAPPATESDWEQRTTRLLQARKAASQARVDRDLIAGEPADRHVNRRTALLLAGQGQVTTRLSPNGRTALVGWQVPPGASSGGVSSAAAITPDGYFLTAAHAVTETRMQLVYATSAGLAVAPARVVWKGDPSSGGPDLALVHVAARDQPFFPLGDAASLPSQARVWTAGFGDIRQNQSRGRLRAVGDWRHGSDAMPWRLVEHTAPLMRGDSGGPLIDRHGRLLGINTEFLVQPARLLGHDHLRVYRPMAVAADPSWLEGLIARDRATSPPRDRNRRARRP